MKKRNLFLGIAVVAMLAWQVAVRTRPWTCRNQGYRFQSTFVNNATRSVMDPSFTTADLGSSPYMASRRTARSSTGDVVESQDNGVTWDYNPKKYWIEGNQYAFRAIAPANNANIRVSGHKCLDRAWPTIR